VAESTFRPVFGSTFPTRSVFDFHHHTARCFGTGIRVERHRFDDGMSFDCENTVYECVTKNKNFLAAGNDESARRDATERRPRHRDNRDIRIRADASRMHRRTTSTGV
jgi:hypothetical protein